MGSNSKLLLTFLLSWFIGVDGFGATNDPSLECIRRLRQIFEALQAYRQIKGDWPERLSDLHPEFVAEVRMLSCPVAVESRNFEFGIREFRNALGDDPSTSYNYELNRNLVRLEATQHPLSNREFKFLQRKTPAGDKVPIVRCCNHGAPLSCLNLGFDGGVYASPAFWEINWRDRIPHSYLIPEAVLKDTRAIPARIPPRKWPGDDTVINLSAHYNGCLNDCWYWGKGEAPLRELLSTDAPMRLSGPAVSGMFDTRGVIQLDGAAPPGGKLGFSIPMFPTNTPRIAINREAGSIDFLIGTLFEERSGIEVARITIHYGDGTVATIPILYGHEVEDFLSSASKVRALEGPVVWKSSADRHPLFLKRWINPRPDERIESMQFVSAMAVSAPFLVAASTHSARPAN